VNAIIDIRTVTRTISSKKTIRKMGFLFLILHAPVGNFYGIQCG
jgi:hypothetical protein